MYDQSRSDFYPGVKAALWNIDSNFVEYVKVVAAGNLTPAPGSFEATRWADFTAALSPNPNNSSLSFAAQLAYHPIAHIEQRYSEFSTLKARRDRLRKAGTRPAAKGSTILFQTS